MGLFLPEADHPVSQHRVSKMGEVIVWLIIACFYAPLHFVMPVLVLFITGRESEAIRRGLICRALIDSALSMAVAFGAVVLLVGRGHISTAMLTLLLSLLYPFVGIWRHRRQISAPHDGADEQP